VTFDLDLDLEHTLDARLSGDHQSCVKSGGDPATSVVEEAICAKKFTEYRQTDRQTDDGRCAIALAHGMS